MTDPPSDPLLHVLVELRDLKQRVANAIGVVNEAIIAQANHPIAPDYEAQRHEVAIPEPFAERIDACGE